MPELIITMIFAATFTGIINEVPILIYRYCIRKAPCKPGAKTWWLTFLYSVIVNALFNFALMQIYEIDDLKFTVPYLWIIVSYFVVIHGYDKNDVAAVPDGTTVQNSQAAVPDGSTVRNSHVPVVIMSCISIAFFVLAFYLYVLYAGQVSVAEDAIQQYENLEDQYKDLKSQRDSLQSKCDSLQSDYNDLKNEYRGMQDSYNHLIDDRDSDLSLTYQEGYYAGYIDGSSGN